MGAAFILNFVRFLLIALEVAILGRVILSWVDPRGGSAAGMFLTSITEPLLGPIRRLLPRGGMLDFSPFIALLVIGTILRTLP